MLERFAYKKYFFVIIIIIINNLKLWEKMGLSKSNHSGQTAALTGTCAVYVTCFPSLLFFLPFMLSSLFIPLTLPSSSSFSSPGQCPTLCHCGHQPPPVEPGLWDNPIGLSGGEGRARLLGNVGSDGGDSSYFQSAATPQSHVPEQLRRPPQPGTQGTTDGSTSTYI